MGQAPVPFVDADTRQRGSAPPPRRPTPSPPSPSSSRTPTSPSTCTTSSGTRRRRGGASASWIARTSTSSRARFSAFISTAGTPTRACVRAISPCLRSPRCGCRYAERELVVWHRRERKPHRSQFLSHRGCEYESRVSRFPAWTCPERLVTLLDIQYFIASDAAYSHSCFHSLQIAT
ncbi:hypothetical protein C8R45DRAFT_118569 [Mycena sanguinolenta]|nr:hypothetical protein C8R45DRAFT_118569 [Mycena sanguinolenta]